MRRRTIDTRLDVIRPGLDGRTAFLARSETGLGKALLPKLLDAGCKQVFAGVGEAGISLSHLNDYPRTHPLLCPLHDEKMLGILGFMYGGKSDVLINNLGTEQSGSLFGQDGLALAQELMEEHFFRLLRITRAFAPIFKMRGEGGVIVNVLSIYAQVSRPAQGAYSASMAAGLSLTQNLRAELALHGVRVVNVFHGPLESPEQAHVRPPKVAVARVADAVIGAIGGGLEDVYVGDVAEDLHERLLEQPKVAEREVGAGQG